MSKISEKIKNLPDHSGVYLFKDKSGEIIYVGKAASLKRRVSSYFMRAGDIKTEKLVSEVFDLEIRETPSAIEALILESQLIKKLAPKYNIKDKDNKSFLYVGITDEKFPKPILVRGLELNAERYALNAIFGPFTSAGALRESLNILRGIFPWSECKPNQGRPCFYFGIKKCPGVCVGKVTVREYAKNIRNLELFFSGRRDQVIKNFEKEMILAAKKEDFEKAADIRNKLYALNHIRDVSLIKKEDVDNRRTLSVLRYNAMGRVEGYDISNISGEHAVGSMVVFTSGKPDKAEYKKFKIRTVRGANDVGMLREVLSRRFAHSEWPRPDIIFIDGGRGQVNAAQEILKEKKIKIPVLGIAKGLSRKNDRLVFSGEDLELERVAKSFENLFKQVRDEAHRFAIRYHKNLRAQSFKRN
ncbi:MAG: excinuclease ABC subunit UvrC [Patescibacteria group bacterium]